MNDAVNRLVDEARALSAADRARLRAELDRLEPSRRVRNAQCDEMLRAYLMRRHPGLGVNESARRVTEDVATYRDGEFRLHQYLVAPPAGTDARRRELFDLLKLGRKLSYDTIRRAFLGAKLSVEVHQQITDE